jgi:hypothetical protein
MLFVLQIKMRTSMFALLIAPEGIEINFYLEYLIEPGRVCQSVNSDFLPIGKTEKRGIAPPLVIFPIIKSLHVKVKLKHYPLPPDLIF